MTLLLLLTACGDKGDSGAAGLWPSETADAVATYAEIVEASYADSLAAAQALGAALDGLVAAPSTATLDAARQAWLDSREPYLQTEVYRFYDGPIDDPEDGPEGLLNAWPLDENYIDYTVDAPDAGIINGTDAIDTATLEGLNEAGGESNIATGYHAIEFLLWGQDLSETGPGERPHTDYISDGSGTAANQDRRGQYLTVAGELLVSHLDAVHAQWTPSASYRTDFVADEESAFGSILTGMIVLSGFETGGERLQASLDSGDQEDEHSCFSDNTHRDMVQDVQGISNVWTGQYVRTDGSTVSGVSIKSIVASVDADLAAQLDAQIAESLSLANAIQAPYDQEIAPGAAGNARVEALIISLRAQEDLLFQVFDAFGLSVAIPE
ncbi:MAG: imelysin family protein [Myxococcota bacterium]|nr:imelysin family protein [Myxococcota bacterium]